MKIIANTTDKSNLLQIEEILERFQKAGSLLADGGRNQIRIFDFNGKQITVKAFKIPNVVNKIAYRFFRKSKAQRSFEYATRLLKEDILTPQPIAYAEEKSGATFGKSFYLCEYLYYDLTYRDLIENPKFIGNDSILKAFTKFTFEMHEKGIHFLDHSPGNTLIVIQPEGYDFYLVDLNRMEFKNLDYKTRIQNFRRLTPKKEMVEIMAKEYARLAGYDAQKTLDDIWEATMNFQNKFQRKKRLKKKLKFWKN